MGFPLSLSRPSFKQAVGVVVINGVGLPDTRNHEAEFPEGAGSPLPILGERAFGTPLRVIMDATASGLPGRVHSPRLHKLAPKEGQGLSSAEAPALRSSVFLCGLPTSRESV